jgi:hypothetical protein
MSAWDKGVLEYAKELKADTPNAATEKDLLNGADNWSHYSWGGCSLCYDEDICKRLCPPSEQNKKRNGAYRPNRNEEWLDVQARALRQAAKIVLRGGV